jgi:hypothetical protein
VSFCIIVDDAGSCSLYYIKVYGCVFVGFEHSVFILDVGWYFYIGRQRVTYML